MKKSVKYLICIVVILVSGVSLGVVIHNLIFESIVITGTSMMPTYEDGEKRIIIKCQQAYKRTDVVAINTETKGKIIKRIVGTEGDRIKIDNSTGRVYRNDKLLYEDYLIDDIKTYCAGKMIFTVPPDEYFVMGDNRIISVDSRNSEVGFIPKAEILGKVI